MSLRHPDEDEETPMTICPVCRRVSHGLECVFCPRHGVISLREYLAALAMVSFPKKTATQGGPATRAVDAFQVAEASVEYADALIAALKRSKKE
jgi:hypothetical protein